MFATENKITNTALRTVETLGPFILELSTKIDEEDLYREIRELLENIKTELPKVGHLSFNIGNLIPELIGEGMGAAAFSTLPAHSGSKVIPVESFVELFSREYISEKEKVSKNENISEMEMEKVSQIEDFKSLPALCDCFVGILQGGHFGPKTEENNFSRFTHVKHPIFKQIYKKYLLPLYNEKGYLSSQQDKVRKQYESYCQISL